MNFITDNNLPYIHHLYTENDVEYYSIDIKDKIENFHFSWSEPMAHHFSAWHPLCGRGRHMPQWFGAQKTESCFYRGAPVLSTISSIGNNVISVSLFDTISPIEIKYYVDDFNEKYEVIFEVNIKPESFPYSTVLRIDKRNISFSQAIKDVSSWWTSKSTKKVPEAAYEPLYSSWYNFHQDPSQSELTEELKKASKLGFKTFILDDGWQIEGNGTKNYLRSGDWLVSQDKFPDFNQFVYDVHSYGMKFILWFSVPFVGYETEAFKRFKDKLLYEEDGYLYAGILDIRYPEVRRYIAETYIRFIKDYDIDGLKLDFIDNFRCTSTTPQCNDNMDCNTVEQAVITLLKEICQSINSIKPDFLFEYRQFYVGPTILEYGNMIRVADCAFDPLTNRIGIADLRLLTKNIAVHSDMLLWSPVESTENCCIQLLNVMFSAVQISVLLKQSTDEQITVIKSFLEYATSNKDVLLKGDFTANHPELNYTSLSSELSDINRKITVLYSDEIYEYTGMCEDIWNATPNSRIIILNENNLKVKIKVTDFIGNVISESVTTDKVIFKSVPTTGMIRIEK